MERTLTLRERDRTFSSCVCVVVILAERADSVLSNEAGEESSFCEGDRLERCQWVGRSAAYAPRPEGHHLVVVLVAVRRWKGAAVSSGRGIWRDPVVCCGSLVVRVVAEIPGARQVDAVGDLQVLGVLGGQHQPLYSGQPLGKAELCTVTSYVVDTTMAPLIDSRRCFGPASTRTSSCPVIRQFWGSLYIDGHAWRLIPPNLNKNLQNVETTESLDCLQHIVILLLYGGLVCIHTRLVLARTGITCDALNWGFWRVMARHARLTRSPCPEYCLSGQERSLPLSKTPRSPSFHHHSSPTNRR